MVGEHKRSSFVPVVLLGVLLLGTIIAVTVVTLILFSRYFSSVASPRVSPLSLVKAGGINPAVALGSLANNGDQQVVERALAGNSTDTAFAVLLYSISLSDQERTAGFLNLSRYLTQNGKKDEAIHAVRIATDVAILSPLLPDYARAVALDQAGQILVSLGRKEEAAHVYESAATITQYSTRLDPFYRRLLLESLADDIARLGRHAQARALRATAQVEPPQWQSSTSSVLSTMVVPLTGDDNPLWTELDIATTERIELTLALISALEGNSPMPAETVRQQLEKALLNEDRLRNEVYNTGLAESTNLLQRAAYARARMDWLTLKWCIARQGFGIALVPLWESQERNIETTLRQAAEEYYIILRDVAISLPDQLQAIQGTIEVIQDYIKLGRLGLPLSPQEGELLRALDKATAEMKSLGGNNLFVTVKTEKGESWLTVVSSQ